MADPAIRLARADEIAQVAELMGEMYAYQREHGMVLQLAGDPVEIWKRQLAGRLDAPGSAVFVAEGGEPATLCGFLAAQTKRLPPHLAAARSKVGFISELFVRTASRRQQVGRRLVDAAFEWFDRAEVGSIELHVLVNNEAGRQFWADRGFVPELLQMRAIRA